MPRKPIRRHQIAKPWPFTFSPFGRSVAQAMAYKVKRQIQNSKFRRKSTIKSAGISIFSELFQDNYALCQLANFFYAFFVLFNFLTGRYKFKPLGGNLPFDVSKDKKSESGSF